MGQSELVGDDKDRYERLKLLKQEYAARKGRDTVPPDLVDAAIPAHGAQAVKEAQARKGSADRATPKEQELLDAVVAAGHKHGDPVNAPDFKDVIGITSSRASQLMGFLAKKGLWPYARKSSRGRPPGPGPHLADDYPGLKARINGDPPAGGSFTRTIREQVAQAPIVREPAAVPRPDPAYVPNSDPKADAELLVIQRVLSQFARLPTAASKKRVIDYLWDRLKEEESSDGTNGTR